ncbi:MAG: YebC/PmpR family DNA-binding transcriptional regulator [Bacteroidetes bacterium]|nr:YebC/PmpR family DNA-binding transcriptional regulator [Bacteroidota bacterium]
MSGHSKWAQIKRQKAATDARKGQTFTKMAREITVAARQGGGDPEANFRLRIAIQKAREVNVPMDNIERAIKRGVGGGEGAALEEITYEGYGPGGAALMITVTTDNRNRAASDIRSVLTRGGGNLGESGSVAWLFEPRGVIIVDTKGKDADELALQVIDAGAVDFKEDDDAMEVYTEPTELEAVRRELDRQNIKVVSAESSMIPKTTISLDPKEAEQVLKLMDRLEELDDVQRVYTNVDFPEELLEAYA